MLTFAAQLSLDFVFGHVKKLPEVGEEVLAETFSIQLGGGTLTYPIVLTRLGLDCRLIVKSASSVHGDLAWRLLEERGIREIVTVPAEGFDPVMSTAVISLEKDRSFVSRNDPGAFDFDDAFLLPYLSKSPVVFAQLQNRKLLPRLKAAGCIVVFDVGWSEDLDLSDFSDVLPHVDYFTPNDKEAMKMTGAATVEESVRILSGHVPHPIVSCGARGCMSVVDGAIVTVPPPDVASVDSTGAGDNFMSGLIYAICRGMSIVDAMRFANCTGALSTTGYGCYGTDYRLADVLELMQRM